MAVAAARASCTRFVAHRAPQRPLWVRFEPREEYRNQFSLLKYFWCRLDSGEGQLPIVSHLSAEFFTTKSALPTTFAISSTPVDDEHAPRRRSRRASTR